LAFAPVVGSYGLRFVFVAIRFFVRTRRAPHWPSIPGKIERADVLPPGSSPYLRLLSFRSMFSYAYMVNGSKYWGSFVVVAEDLQSATELQQRVDGCAVMVRYDPKNPRISLLGDKEIVGRQIIQDPMYFDSW
jgi:hypothetical protein